MCHQISAHFLESIRSISAFWWPNKLNEIGFFPDILMRTHWRHDLKFGMLIYADHLFRNNSILSSIGPIFALWWPKTWWNWDFMAFKGDAKKEWSEMRYADVSIPPQKWFDFGQYWPNFGPLVTTNYVKLGVPGIPRKCVDGMARNMACKCIMTAIRTDPMTFYSKQILFQYSRYKLVDR